MTAKHKSDQRRMIAAIGGVVAGICVAVFGNALGWFAGLDAQAVYGLGILAGCVIWWIFGVLPESITGIIMIILFVVVCGVPTETAFFSFASPTWWLLVAAFSLGFGMQHSGLMKRMAQAILRVFPHTFKMQAAGLIAAGTVVGPFIPSLAAKATMLAPLSLGISDSMGYERGGRQASGLFLAMFTGLRNISPAVISASIIGYALVATLPPDIARQFDMVHWFLGMLPWFIVVTVVNYVAIAILYSPRLSRESAILSSGSDSVNDEFPQNVAGVGMTNAAPSSHRRDSSGHDPLSRAEKRLAVIMVACIVLWITEPLHMVPSHVVALAAMVVMVACGVVTMKELRQNIAWDSLIFIGCVLGLAQVFAALGIDTWLVASFAPAFEVLAVNPYLLILGLCGITIALRFIIVSETAFINIFMAFMVPLAVSLGINPWVMGVSVYAVIDPWFALYQNPIYMTAYYATEGDMVRQGPMVAYCVVYLLICTAGLLVSVPYWQWMSLM